jgi:hypothetical protein
VQGLFREHLKCAVRDLTGGVIGIPLRGVGLGFVVGEDDLDVTLRPKGPTIDQWGTRCYTFTIDV